MGRWSKRTLKTQVFIGSWSLYIGWRYVRLYCIKAFDVFSRVFFKSKVSFHNVKCMPTVLSEIEQNKAFKTSLALSDAGTKFWHLKNVYNLRVLYNWTALNVHVLHIIPVYNVYMYIIYFFCFNFKLFHLIRRCIPIKTTMILSGIHVLI